MKENEIQTVKDEVVPAEKWKFDEEVTAAFDDMLRRSIPQHDLMRSSVFELGKRFVASGTDVVDLGCSRGEALAPFVEHFGAQNRFVGVEVAPAMIESARRRFSGYERSGIVSVIDHDLRKGYPPVKASLTLAILTIQFTPIEHRLRILRDVGSHTVPGGAFIMVEKVLGNDAEIDGMFVDRYIDMKRANGYTDDQIERKKLSLEGVLVPVTARWNEEMLRGAGFSTVDCFWRWMCFAGWIAIK